MSHGFNAMDVVFEKDGRFRTIGLTNSHYATNVACLFDRFTVAGWEIVSVVVFDECGPTEIGENNPPADKVAELFDVVESENSECAKATAFIMAWGWDHWIGNAWEDAMYFRAANEEEMAKEYVSVYYFDGNAIDFPEEIREAIDWQAVADHIQSECGYEIVRHNGETWAFNTN